MNTENIVIAIGVCANAAESAYDAHLDKQSDKWNALRSSVYHLTELLEEAAREEVSL